LRDFNGKRALVTGAASGLGRCLAADLAERGADVVIIDVNEEGLHETAAMVEAKGRRCLARRVDVSDYAAMRAMAEEVVSDWGGVDILVNNAGVGVGGELKDVPIEDFEWIVGINLMGEVYGTKLFLPGMIERGAGHIVNVASLSGLVVLPLHLPYTTTKFALAGFSEALWIELKRRGIGVTMVCPGAIRTNIMDSTRTHEGEGSSMQFAHKWQGVLQKTGKEPEEVSRIALRAVEHDRFMALTGPEAYLLYYMKRLAPGLQRRIVAFITGLLARG
jgi:NAD(P)-dependent dehydrogenase (short-subunit alcohol dehydrogenase family)